MLDMIKEFPQLCFRFDCSFPPCLLDEIEEDEYPLVERFIYHDESVRSRYHNMER